mmetsp:Transcript_490/g.741  ORF Transcript_490/g.741 Transcript_490/m.741 type:complete len:647 (+) Transcript_490:118-2058(+)
MEDDTSPTSEPIDVELQALGEYCGKPWSCLDRLGLSCKSFILQQQNLEETELLEWNIFRFGIDPRLWSLKQLTLLDLSQASSYKEGEDVCSRLQHLGPVDLEDSNVGLPNLEELRDLILSNNLIGPSLLPTGCLDGLSNLRTLNLENNLLECLPASIVSLSSLVSLNVNYNKLTGLPGNLGLLPALQSLKADGNLISTESLNLGSKGLIDSPRLSEISLSANKLTGTLPELFGLIKSLSIIDVSNNGLTALHPNLGSASLKIKKLIIANNPFQDKKFKKLAATDKCQAKAILQLLRKGKSKRQAKVEEKEKAEASRAPPPRQFTTEIGKRKRILLHRDVLSVRPVICAAILHVVNANDALPNRSEHEGLFFGSTDVENENLVSSLETEIALLEQKETFSPRLTDDTLRNDANEQSDSYMDVSDGARSLMKKFNLFIRAQTLIHHNPELGNKRRNGALGSHNASALSWPLHFLSCKRKDDTVKFSPLREGWMEGKGKCTPREYATRALSIPDLRKHAQALLSLPRFPMLVMKETEGVNSIEDNYLDSDVTVLSVSPLTNGWETRTTPLAAGGILIECSAGDESLEVNCRQMLLQLIKETIKIIEESNEQGKQKVVLVEAVDIVRAWNKQLQTTFPSYEEFSELPEIT